MFLNNTDSEHVHNAQNTAASVHIWHITETSCLRRDNERWPFLEVLVFLRNFGVTDPRDRVYAALGLAIGLISDAIEPDYEKTVADVYREVAEFLIRRAPEGHKLDILGYVDNETVELRELEGPTIAGFQTGGI